MNKSAVFLRATDRRIGTELHSAITCARMQRDMTENPLFLTIAM